MKIELNNSGLDSVSFDRVNEDDLFGLCEELDYEYGSGFVVGNSFIIFENGWNKDELKKDIMKYDFIKNVK